MGTARMYGREIVAVDHDGPYEVGSGQPVATPEQPPAPIPRIRTRPLVALVLLALVVPAATVAGALVSWTFALYSLAVSSLIVSVLLGMEE